MELFFKSVLFAILLPGTVTVFVPSLIIFRGHLVIQWTSWRVLALVPLVFGGSILLHCIRDFAVSGRGTLAPVDPPKELVVRGPYRYVRNPMYVGVLLILFSEAWLFNSRALLLYALGAFVVEHAFVRLYEEPHLRRKFGAAYVSYCKKVDRWLPGKPPP